MVIPEDRDGRMGVNPDLAKDTSARGEQDQEASSADTSSRQGAGQKQANQAVKAGFIFAHTWPWDIHSAYV